MVRKSCWYHPVPSTQGKTIKLKFITQVHSEPPVFAIFCNYPKLISTSYSTISWKMSYMIILISQEFQ